MNSGLFRSMFSVEFERKEEEQRKIYLANDMKEMTRKWCVLFSFELKLNHGVYVSRLF